MEAFLHAKPLSTDWREMLSALDGGRRSPVCEPSFQDFRDSKSAHQAAGANRLPATWHTGPLRRTGSGILTSAPKWFNLENR